MAANERMTPEQIEQELEYWRARARELFPMDPEAKAALGEFQIDTEATPEEDLDDLRFICQRAERGEPSIPLEVFLRELAEEFPDEAEDILSGL